MTNTPYAITFSAPITVYGIDYVVRCTASPRHGQPPAVLWIEDERTADDLPPYLTLPAAFWQEVERQFVTGGPVRDAYEAGLAEASTPRWSVAAE